MIFLSFLRRDTEEGVLTYIHILHMPRTFLFSNFKRCVFFKNVFFGTVWFYVLINPFVSLQEKRGQYSRVGRSGRPGDLPAGHPRVSRLDRRRRLTVGEQKKVT